VLLVTTAAPCPVQGQVTQAQAQAFWNDFDTQALSGRGPEINAVYLPGIINPTPQQIAQAKSRAQTEIFNGFQSFATLAVDNEVLKAHGLPVPTKRQQDVARYYNDLTSLGVVDRLSRLQLDIIQKHFPANGGGIDFGKFQQAVELFANGAIRAGGGNGAREMDQLHQWYVWKNFAVVAILNNIDQNTWGNLLHSLEEGLEIYRVVYPAPAGGFPLKDSDHNRFNAGKQLTAAQITQLRTDINNLDVDTLLTREANALKLDTPQGRADAGAGAVLNFDSIQTAAVAGGFQVNLQAHLSDSQGAPIDGDPIGLLVSPVGIEVPQDALGESLMLSGRGGGEYSASFTVPTPELGYTFSAIDENNLASDAASLFAVPEPPPATLLLLGTLGSLALGRLWQRQSPSDLGGARIRAQGRRQRKPPHSRAVIREWGQALVGLGTAVVIVALGAGVGRGDDLTWTGQTNDDDWTTMATDKNWKNKTGATPFANGDKVTFDDSASGPTTLFIQNNGVAPGNVLFNNTVKTYTLRGGSITGKTALVKDGADTLIVSNNNTFTGGVTIRAGTLEIGANDALPTTTPLVIERAGTLGLDITTRVGSFNQKLAGLQGEGRVIIGDLQVPTLTLDVPQGRPEFRGTIASVRLGSGINLVKDGAGIQILNLQNVDANRILKVTVNAGRLDGGLPKSVLLTVADPGKYNVAGRDQTLANLSGTGEVTNRGRAMQTLTVISGDYNGKITGNLNLEVEGGLKLRNASTYRGDTTVSGGKLFLTDRGGGGGVTRDFLPTSTVLTVKTPGVVSLDGGTFQTVAGLEGNGNVYNPTAITATLTVKNLAIDDHTFSGTIGSSGSPLGGGNMIALVMKGLGKQTLTGANTYDQGTTITGGTLLVNNTQGSGTGSGDVRVTGGKLDGTGTIAGEVFATNAGMVGNKLTIQGGVKTDPAVIGVGDTPGKLTISKGLDMGAGGTYAWQLAARTNAQADAGRDYSIISLTSGNLTLGANAKLKLEFLNNTTPDATVDFWTKIEDWDIIRLADPNNQTSSNFGGWENARFAGVGSFSTYVSDGQTFPKGDIVLEFTPLRVGVPEPSTLVLAGIAGTLLVACRAVRRRVRKVGAAGRLAC
jgi:autotransporter-associated beta strand protein